MSATRIRVWDLPTRLFHWLLLGGCSAAWISSGSDRWLDLHVFAGYLVLALLGFRLLWGFVGGRYARFADFTVSPRRALAYLRALRQGRAERHLGHNPAGAWAVFALLGLIAVTALTGLVVFGGEEGHGPLAGVVSIPTGAALHEWHGVLAWSLLGLVGLHLIGVLVESRVHRENLTAAMVSGYKPYATGATPSRRYAVVGGVMLLAVMGGGALWFQGYATATPDKPYRPFTGPTLAHNADWDNECGACHLAYGPWLLPARAWERLLAGQHDHFGEDLYLAPQTIERLRRFALANSAEAGRTEAAWKIARSLSGAAPLRITDTPYWQHKHAAIPEAVWRGPKVNGKGDCAACHLDAREGTFEDAAMRLP